MSLSLAHAPARRWVALLGLAALLAIAAGCGSAHAGARDRGHFRFFSSSSFWNTPLAKDAPLAGSSARIVRTLGREVAAELRDERGPSINTDRWSVPIYTVPASQPPISVLLDPPRSPTLQAAWEAVPLPPDARPSAGSDKHLVVWQPSTDRLWEFWHLRGGPGDWRASWGGAMEHVSLSSGVYGPAAWPGASASWGASASSLSLAGGLITLEDLERGWINHALALAVPDVRAGVFASPAQRTDGESTNPLSLPEGAHLRLDPRLRLGRLHLPPLTRMIAQAAQRYGIFVRSRASVIVFYGQDPTPTGANPYIGPNGFFEGRNRLELFGSFPWKHLQLIKMNLRRASG